MGYEIDYIVPLLSAKFGSVNLVGAPSVCKSFSIADGAIVFADVTKIITGGNKLSDTCKDFEIIIQKQ